MMKTYGVVGLVAAMVWGGCAAFPAGNSWPRTSRLGRNIRAFRPKIGGGAGKRNEFSQPRGAITLQQALAAALMNNPRLQAAAWEVRAREAERLQAGLLPNPDLDVTAEGFGGSRVLRGVREMELSVSVSQLLWLGGQRARRERLAAMQGREAGWRYELERLAVLTETARAFITVVALQRLEDLTRKEERLVEKMVDMFQQRSQAGRIARRDVGRLRVEVRLSRVRLRLDRIRGRLLVARKKLASTWGGKEVRFERAVGRLDSPGPFPKIDAILEKVAESPKVKAWQARLETRKAAVALARAQAVPNLTVTGGVRVLPETGSVGMLVGLSLPLPIFDRNQGGIQAATFRVIQAREQVRSARVEVATLVSQAHQRVVSAQAALRRIDETILPKAEAALEGALDAYREGKADYLTVLDAQRTVVQLRVESLGARTELLQAVTDLEFLLGEPLRRTRSKKTGAEKRQGDEE